MKRLLLPLLAALALPNAVNAERNFPKEIFPEEIYLACKSRSQFLPYFEVFLNTKTNAVKVVGTGAEDHYLNQSSGNFYIVGYVKDTKRRETININRFNGRFKLDTYFSSNGKFYFDETIAKGKCEKVSLEERAF